MRVMINRLRRINRIKMLLKFIVYSQNLRLNSTGDLADHNLKVFTTLFPYPGTGLSYGIANTTLERKVAF